MSINVPLVGVFCKDELPKRCKQGCYVINLANHNEVGTHWNCFVIEADRCYYFDSFGCPPVEEVTHFCRNLKTLIYNTRQIQADASECCGWFCVCFLHYFTHNKGDNKIQRFVNQFKQNKQLILNDKILQEYIKKYIR